MRTTELSRVTAIPLLIAIGLFCGGADGCNDAGMVGAMDGDDGGPPRDSGAVGDGGAVGDSGASDDGGAIADAGASADAGPLADAGAGAFDAGRDAAPRPDGGPSPLVVALDHVDIVAGDGAAGASISVQLYDLPAAPGPTASTTVLETVGSCEMRRVRPPVSGRAVRPVDLGPAVVSIAVGAAAPQSLVADSGGSYGVNLMPPPAPGTRVRVTVDAPGNPPIVRELRTTRIEIAAPRLVEHLPSLPGRKDALYRDDEDLVVRWPVAVGSYGNAGLTVYANADHSGTVVYEYRCDGTYASGAFTVPWRLLDQYFIDSDYGDAGFIVFNEGMRETADVDGIAVNVVSTSARQAVRLLPYPI